MSGAGGRIRRVLPSGLPAPGSLPAPRHSRSQEAFHGAQDPLGCAEHGRDRPGQGDPRDAEGEPHRGDGHRLARALAGPGRRPPAEHPAGVRLVRRAPGRSRAGRHLRRRPQPHARGVERQGHPGRQARPVREAPLHQRRGDPEGGGRARPGPGQGGRGLHGAHPSAMGEGPRAGARARVREAPSHPRLLQLQLHRPRKHPEHPGVRRWGHARRGRVPDPHLAVRHRRGADARGRHHGGRPGAEDRPAGHGPARVPRRPGGVHLLHPARAPSADAVLRHGPARRGPDPVQRPRRPALPHLRGHRRPLGAPRRGSSRSRPATSTPSRPTRSRRPSSPISRSR